jgi:hypothetical protein
VDEIWNPQAIIDFTGEEIFKLQQLVYVYYINNRSNEPWTGTLVTKYKNIKNSCLNHLRTASKPKYTYIPNGGWHFTNQGGEEFIRNKINASYSSDDLNNDEVQAKLQERIRKNKDYIGRKFKYWIDEKDLPLFILNYRDK